MLYRHKDILGMSNRLVDIPVMGRCEHPVVLKDGSHVPCGRCSYCLARFQKMWLTRMNMEYKSVGGYFLTLTFNEEHINNTSYKVVQDFLKRFRYFFPNIVFKYFGCFEKGDKFGRPHFHIIIFSKQRPNMAAFKGKVAHTAVSNFKNVIHRPTLNDYLSEYIWQQGYCRLDEITDNGETSLAYVARYVTKKKKVFSALAITSNLPKKEISKLNKFSCNDEQFNETMSSYTKKSWTAGRSPFYFMSKALGEDYFRFVASQSSFQEVLRRGSIVLQGVNVPIPRFFFLKFGEKLLTKYGIPIYEEMPYYFKQFLHIYHNDDLEECLTDLSTLEPDILAHYVDWFLHNWCIFDDIKDYAAKIKGELLNEL